MKRNYTSALAAAVLSFGIAAAAHAQTTPALGPGVMGQMMQGHAMQGRHGAMGGGMAHGMQAGPGGARQHGPSGMGALEGGCPMMSQNAPTPPAK